MLLQNKFDDLQLNLTLELFLRMLKEELDEQLVSVVLYGSILFDDLSLGYSDLDFLAVVKDDLSDDIRNRLIELRKPLRSGDYGIYATMIEGAFLPIHMFDPIVKGKALWWGTSGERFWECNKLGWLVLKVIRDSGNVIWGEDIRDKIPIISHENLIEDIRAFALSLREHGRGGGLHSVDWLLTTARELLLLKEGKFCSKSQAADWGYIHAKGDWRKLLPKAKEMRLTPSLASSSEAQIWLDGLTEPIQEAYIELEQELSKY